MSDEPTSVDEDEDLRSLTISQVADDLRVSRDTAERMARGGELPAFKVGRLWRIDAAEFSRWKRARTRAETSRRQRMAGVL